MYVKVIEHPILSFSCYLKLTYPDLRCAYVSCKIYKFVFCCVQDFDGLKRILMRFYSCTENSYGVFTPLSWAMLFWITLMHYRKMF